MSPRDKRHLDRAVAVAGTSTCNKRHGVVIAHGNKVLAVGVNTPRSANNHFTQANFHAEVAAIRALRTSVPHASLTLYSARVLADGTPALARPCAACQTLIDYLDFGGVIWT